MHPSTVLFLVSRRQGIIIFFRFCPFAITDSFSEPSTTYAAFCSFNRTMYLAIVMLDESEQCINSDWREWSSETISICSKSISFLRCVVLIIIYIFCIIQIIKCMFFYHLTDNKIYVNKPIHNSIKLQM